MSLNISETELCVLREGLARWHFRDIFKEKRPHWTEKCRLSLWREKCLTYSHANRQGIMKTYKELQVSKDRPHARGALRRLSQGKDVQTKVWVLVRILSSYK